MTGGGHHHRAGPLKQQNKKHKSGKHDTKTRIANKLGGKVEKNTHTKSNAAKEMNKNNKHTRMLKQKQMRQNKRDEVLLKKRIGAGGNQGPPKIIALISLGDMADLKQVQQALWDGATSVEEPSFSASNVTFQHTSVAVFAQHKQKLCIIECGNDLLASMDAAKVADIIVYVLPLYHGAENALNPQGDKILSAIRAQGVPSIVGCIQGTEIHGPKVQNDLKKYGQRFFQTEFGDAVKIVFPNVHSQLVRAVLSISPKTIHWRDTRSYMLASSTKIVPGPSANQGTLHITGYLRGKPLSVNQLLHITDVGTFQMSHILQATAKSSPVDAKQVSSSDKMDMDDDEMVDATETEDAQEDSAVVLAKANPEIQEDLRYQAEYDPFAAEQTWPTEEEIEEAERNAQKNKVASKGMSNYQATWLTGSDDEEENTKMNDSEQEVDDKKVSQDFCQVGTDKTQTEEEDDGDDISMIDEEEQDEATRIQEYALMKEKRRLENENMVFPDEIDVPRDIQAKTRFARYRGMKSMRTSHWDPQESLPIDYARLFQFDDFALSQKRVLDQVKEAEEAMKMQLLRKIRSKHHRNSMASSNGTENMEDIIEENELTGMEGYVLSGSFVTLIVKEVPLAEFNARLQKGPLILGSLLKHENRLSVLNFSIQRASTFSDPLKSKEQLTFHCGFRRYQARPIFSDQSLKSDKHLFQRFLPQNGWSVASIYGPATFQPASVLLSRSTRLEPFEMVASGTLMNVNPDRIVLKRVVITGTPVKVKKRKAVVRFMFHTPEDIRWFKPVELVTKHGMTGHIKESLGTHGDFKAVFNKPVKQHDTVCLNLYKRVYPKFCEA